jgi:hypothetical protein
MLPNFYIVGAPKSGTTSLFHYLDEHPDVFMCTVKEPNFFSYDEIVQQSLYYSEKGVRNLEAYEALFENVASETAIGEASTSYLFYEKTPAKIKAMVPDAKIIIILRNPVDRGFSHYLMDSRIGYVNISFEDIVQKKTEHPLLDLYYQQFVELGLYYRQVKRFIDVFGESQVKIFLNEDLKEDITKVILSVYSFLDIDNCCMPNITKQYNIYQKPRNTLIQQLYSTKSIRRLARTIIPGRFVDTVKNSLLIKGEKPELTHKTREFLFSLYRDDIQRTADLIGRDLSPWFSVDQVI